MPHECGTKYSSNTYLFVKWLKENIHLKNLLETVHLVLLTPAGARKRQSHNCVVEHTNKPRESFVPT